jgi:hypothetical protein
LLENDTSINLINGIIFMFGIDKYTHFIITDKRIKEEIINILLKNKAEINAKNKAGETPLHIGKEFFLCI